MAADTRGEPVLVLGGGSNVVIADRGFDGLVIRVATRGISAVGEGDCVRVAVEAGEPWDDFVARCVDEGWSGVECLSGIPGLSGATPIQNVGAYGQEVKETIASVRVFDRTAQIERDIDARECGFAYRSSAFKGDSRLIVTRVDFVLPVRAESAVIRYAELARALGVTAGARAPLSEVRRTVIGLRRTKGMVLDAADPDSGPLGVVLRESGGGRCTDGVVGRKSGGSGDRGCREPTLRRRRGSDQAVGRVADRARGLRKRVGPVTLGARRNLAQACAGDREPRRSHVRRNCSACVGHP